jgi:hypothetical protein
MHNLAGLDFIPGGAIKGKKEIKAGKHSSVE